MIKIIFINCQYFDQLIENLNLRNNYLLININSIKIFRKIIMN